MDNKAEQLGLAEAIGTDAGLSGRDVLSILWRGRLAICVITLVVTAAVAAAAFLIPKRYEATVLLQPVSDDSAEGLLGGIGSAISQMGGLASLAGIATPNSSMKAEAVATLQSEAVTERYINDKNLLPIIYSKDWDAVAGRWKIKDPSKVPTPWKANLYFKSRVRDVVDNARTGLVTLTITWRNPRQAAEWANGLVSLTNDYLRNKAIAESDRNIAYLEDQERRTSVVAIRDAISTLTEAEIKKGMLARGREQYALKVLDPATVPERAAYPRPALWIASAFFGGLFIAILAVLMRVPSSNSR